MRNMRPKKVTASNTSAVLVKPVQNTPSASAQTKKNGIAERRFTRSSAGRTRSCCMRHSSDDLPYLPVGSLDHGPGRVDIAAESPA
jgi:hypothetical protein